MYMVVASDIVRQINWESPPDSRDALYWIIVLALLYALIYLYRENRSLREYYDSKISTLFERVFQASADNNNAIQALNSALQELTKTLSIITEIQRLLEAGEQRRQDDHREK